MFHTLKVIYNLSAHYCTLFLLPIYARFSHTLAKVDHGFEDGAKEYHWPVESLTVRSYLST